MLPVPLVGEEEHQIAKVPRSMVVSIIRPRLEETFELVKERLDSSGLSRAAGHARGADRRRLPARRRARTGRHASSTRQVRLGRPIALRGLPESASGPAFATAARPARLGAPARAAPMHDVDLDAGRARRACSAASSIVCVNA